MSMHIDIHEQSVICLFVELGELRLLVVSIFVVVDQQLGCSDGRTKLKVFYVF